MGFTWKEFVETVTRQGVVDATVIDYIDVDGGSPTDDITVSGSGNPSSLKEAYIRD